MDINASNRRSRKRLSKINYDADFVIADQHVVYYDAVMHSPWNHDGGGRLPERDDWSTYRYTVKDIILGIATHRFNKNTRRLEIRAYFVGEHPAFEELEPTKAMMIVFCCQSYQSGGSLDLYFEHGIPFDVRELVERRLNIVVPGHAQLLQEDITKKLFAVLSDFPQEVCKHIEEQGVSVEMVCFNTYRGTWSSNHIKTLLKNSIPLRWLFKQKPDPLRNPVVYCHLLNHLRAVLSEEYAIYHLEDRQLGESFGKGIIRIDEMDRTYYTSQDDLRVTESDDSLEIPAGTRFFLIPIIPRSTYMIYDNLHSDLARAREASVIGIPILVMPMDFIYLTDALRAEYRDRARKAGVQLLVIGVTAAQLLLEVELKLAITAAQIDPDEMDAINVDRYSD